MTPAGLNGFPMVYNLVTNYNNDDVLLVTVSQDAAANDATPRGQATIADHNVK